MKLGIAPLTLFRPAPLDLVQAAGEAGFDAVGFQLGLQEVPVSPLATDRKFLAEAKAAIRRFDLEVMEVSNIVFEPDRTFEEGKVLIDFAAEIGAPIIQATVWDDDRSRVAERLAELADYANTVGRSITVEYMPYSKCVSFQDAVALIDAADRPNLRVLLDTLHFTRSGGQLADLDSPRASLYSFVQLCDARKQTPAPSDLRFESVNDRLPLGEGGVELAGILERIPVELPISLEIPCLRMRDLPLVDQAKEHLRLARTFLVPYDGRFEAALPAR